MTTTPPDTQAKTKSLSIEDSVAGWFFVISALMELVFNRLFTAMGLYNHVGEQGVLSAFSMVGFFSMNAVAVTGLILSCILLPKLAADPLLAPLPARVFLMLTSPLYLPVVCVAIFRPISPPLVLVAYLVSIGSVFYLIGLVAFPRLPGSHRRLLVALILIHVSAAAELILGGYYRGAAQKAHIFAEGIYLATPVLALFFIFQKNLIPLFKRPHLLGLAFAVTVTGSAGLLVLALSTQPPMALILTGYRSLGVTFTIPGGSVIYLVSLFIGALVVGALVLPSKRWPPDPVSRKMGIGLACIWTAGIQATHPYQVILLVTGFLYITRSILDGEFKRKQAALISMQLSAVEN
jgi:hypothetical protein